MASTAAPGPWSWTCGPGRRISETLSLPIGEGGRAKRGRVAKSDAAAEGQNQRLRAPSRDSPTRLGLRPRHPPHRGGKLVRGLGGVADESVVDPGAVLALVLHGPLAGLHHEHHE